MLKMKEFEVFAKRLPSNINIFYLVQNNLLTWYKRRSIVGKSKGISFLDEIFLNPIRRLTTIIRLRQQCKQFDVIIDFDSTFGSMISKKTKARKICFFHFSFATELMRDKRHMKRRLDNMKKFDYVVTLSNAMLKEAYNIAPELKERLVRIYNSINLHRILVQAKAPVDDPRINNNYILAIERLEETQKDISTLVDTYALLKQKDSLKKIWERFYKTDLSRGKDKKGTGLGLSIVKEIIQAHDETINVTSTEGVGSEFVFSLQLAERELE